MSGSLSIRGGRVLTAEGFAQTDLFVEAGLLSGRDPNGEVVIDAGGLLVAPGLIDIQINGGFGFDFTADPSSIWKVGARLPATGVTSFLPTIITSPEEQRFLAFKVLAKGPPSNYRGARVLGLHFEGPMLAPEYRGTHGLAHLRLPDPDLIHDWARSNGLRLVTLAPELPGADPTIRALLDRDVIVAAGHSAAGYEQGEHALRAGVTHGTHLFNGMPPLLPCDPGLVGALLEDEGASVALIVDGIHLHPATVRLVRAGKPAHRVVLITDAMAGMGAGPGTYALGDLTVSVDEMSARNADGGLAGSILTLDQAVRNYVEFTDCTIEEALVAASTNPARAVGECERGQIEDGKMADLVLLDDQLNVHATVVEGVLAHESRAFAGRVAHSEIV